MGIKKCDLLICSGSTAAEGLQRQDGLIPEVLCSFVCFLIYGDNFKTHTKELM